MNLPRPSFRTHLVAVTLSGLASALLSPGLSAQGQSTGQPPTPPQVQADTIERLRRDQDEILRKAERLQKLMQSLLERYQREGKEEVALLQQGLAHLEQTGILREVAGIRDDLSATAFTEALRKQREVVTQLERLLNILLERKSVENLDQQMQTATEMAQTAAELERRQRELQQSTAEALRREPTPAERQLLEQLQQLQRAEADEAQRNAQQAGTRRPFLESALQRVQQLLRQQDQLDQGLADEAAGRTDQNRARQFDLGNLTQRARELASQVRAQGKQDDLQQAAEALRREAMGTDQQALQKARDKFEELVQNAPKLPGGVEGPARDPQWDALREQLKNAPQGATPAERAAEQQIAEAGAKLAAERREQAAVRNGNDSAKLQKDARELAAKVQAAQTAAAAAGAEPDATAKSLQEAADKLQEAEAAARAGEAGKAQEKVDQAMSALERARQQDAARHPDAEQQAGAMAAEAAATEQELRSAPSAEAAERTASDQLDAAEKALRDTQSQIGKAREAGTRPDTAASSKTAREQLEQARDTLQKALDGAAQGRSEDMAAAAERQQQLQQQTEQAATAVQQAQQSGQITPEQAKGTKAQLDAAAKSMQQAQQQLQSGKQSGASADQQQAAEALQKAQQQLQQNQAPAPEQQQALRDQAARQQELADDIAKLAEELKKRDNKAAQRAVEQAADAARKAKRGLEQADPETAQQEQEAARQKLQEAQQELEEERDRYQDLRQEELLFKMKEELTAFLERQRPITAETLEAQQQAEKETLSRPARRKLNQLGETEQELAGKIEFLVTALAEEGNLVYRAVLQANLDDLREVVQRLGGRAPDPGRFTTLLQQDVERRSVELLAALENERKRREQQKKDEKEQKEEGKNKFNPQREKLVSHIAELEMLKRLQQDTARATNDQRTVIEARSDESISEAEVALVERLSHRHAEISKLFLQIKAGIDETLEAMQGKEPEGGEGGRGK